MNKTLVIARYEEDISWTKDRPSGIEVSVVQKGKDLPNKGREVSSFLWYIIQNYDNLEGAYFFAQGNPFPHSVDFIEQLECPWNRLIGHWHLNTDGDGKGSHPGLPVQLTYQTLLQKEFPGVVRFIAGGQFCVSAEKLKAHPKKFYEACYDMVMEEEDIAWVFERIWGPILNITVKATEE